MSLGVAMVQEQRYYVYIMANKSRVIYVGVTGFLMARVLRHKVARAEYLLLSIGCIGWFTSIAFRTWATRLRARRRSRDGGGRRKWL
jgi:predicted GIY-YIG superfamily endonuclease